MNNKKYLQKCIECEKELLSRQYYQNQMHDEVCFCLECGMDKLKESDELAYNNKIKVYVHEDDYQETYQDDEIADVEIYVKESLDEESTDELIEYLKAQIGYKNAEIKALRERLE